MVSKILLPLLSAVVALSAQQPSAKPSQAAPPAASSSDFFHQAPPGVEESLRARLKTFYDCYLNGKFRVAYELVAEENKDDYFDRSKTTYHSYKIGSIEFSDNYSKAKVMVITNRDMVFQGHTFAVDVPMTAYWKLENGQWVWYLLYRNLRGQQTPFGLVPPEPPSEKAKVDPAAASTDPSPDGPKALPKIPNDPRSMTAAFDSLAWPDKPVLALGPGNQFQDNAVLSNHSNRTLKFHLEFKPLAGLKVEPAKGQIDPGQSVKIQAKYDVAGRGLPLDRSVRQIRIVYEGAGMVEVQVVWASDVPTKTAAAKIQ
ncbi:MAG TPA: hypothetical protein VHZ07_26755 [Bryobacteraceae bacterium]|jgi:hypothetical protein|nr:hypothetical protein [Bryobacteraceae bacterium]